MNTARRYGPREIDLQINPMPIAFMARNGWLWLLPLAKLSPASRTSPSFASLAISGLNLGKKMLTQHLRIEVEHVLAVDQLVAGNIVRQFPAAPGIRLHLSLRQANLRGSAMLPCTADAATVTALAR